MVDVLHFQPVQWGCACKQGGAPLRGGGGGAPLQGGEGAITRGGEPFTPGDAHACSPMF